MENIKDKNIYLVYLISVIKGNITCSLIISEFFENGLFFSDLNDTPEKKIDDNFPKNKIYININSNKECDCGFEGLKFLTKIEIYEKFMEKIKKLISKYEKIINEKDKKIKDLENINEEVLINIDKNQNNFENELKSISNEMEKFVKFKQSEENIKFEDFYDLIINIKSIKEVNNGWDIKMNEMGKLRFEDYKNKDALIIGIIGNSNKGKSFLLSKIKTEGLSIKYPELEKFKNRKIVLLDSEGFEAPFLIEKNEIFDKSDVMLKEQAREKMITEYFLQDFILNNSDILLAVVGLLTFQEQKFLNKIKSDISKLKLKKTLFIIHNLMTLTTIEQVENYINNILLNSATFELEKTTLISTKISIGEKSVEYFYENNDKIKTIHLIFANEGSEAGKYYNDFALEFIENSFQNVTGIKPFDVIAKLKERFVALSNILIEKNKNSSLITLNDFLDDDNILKEKKFRLKNKREIILKRLFIDELGFSNLRNNGFNPCFNYYIKNNNLILKLEAPGNINIACDHKIVDKYNIIEIRGRKNKDKEPENLKDNIFNGREFGEFSVDIPLMIELENIKPNISKKEGLFIIEFPLKQQINKIFEYKGDDEEI